MSKHLLLSGIATAQTVLLEGGVGNSRRLIRFRLAPPKSARCDKPYARGRALVARFA